MMKIQKLLSPFRVGLMFGLVLTLPVLCVSCSESNEEEVIHSKEVVVPDSKVVFTASNPYLVCAGRNPAGIGFDFSYQKQKGGALEMALLEDDMYKTVAVDMVIRTIKAEKEGKPMGCPFIQLFHGAKALKYSEKTGLQAYKTLSNISIDPSKFVMDQEEFDVNSIAVSASGFREYALVRKQFDKLVIGDHWKMPLFNSINDDEPIWIIKTSDNKYVKMIVSEFPSKKAPTKTGYCNIEWDLIENTYEK